MSESMLTARFLRNLLRKARMTITIETILNDNYNCTDNEDDANQDEDAGDDEEPVEDGGGG